MALPFTLNDTGVRLRGAAVTGSYGSQELDWTSPVQLSMRCEFQPLVGIEDVTGQQRTENRWKVFLPAGADITARDRFRFAGVDYEVIAEPKRWRLRGVEHHVEVDVQLVSGG